MYYAGSCGSGCILRTSVMNLHGFAGPRSCLSRGYSSPAPALGVDQQRSVSSRRGIRDPSTAKMKHKSNIPSRVHSRLGRQAFHGKRPLVKSKKRRGGARGRRGAGKSRAAQRLAQRLAWPRQAGEVVGGSDGKQAANDVSWLLSPLPERRGRRWHERIAELG